MKTLPFTRAQIDHVIKRFPTPFHIYDEAGIRAQARRFRSLSKTLNGFKNYFAVKALPNPHIMKILQEEGMGADASSFSELLLCERAGIRGENIMFTSSDTPQKEYQKALKLGAIINLDDISHIPHLLENGILPSVISFRFNPGASLGPISQSFIIGKPEEAKFGDTREHLLKGYRIMKEKGVKRFGIHTMIASNQLDHTFFIEIARKTFDLALEISRKAGIVFEFVNLGGGIGIPYRPEQKPFELEDFARGVKKAYESVILSGGHPPLRILMENGRFVTGPYGYLVTTVLHLKRTYKNYVGVDASMANLMRPGMYGAYHHVSVLGKVGSRPAHLYDVVGGLCENNDKFAIDRKLPAVEEGDLLVIHDTGAHGHSMGFNYNGKLRSAELLLKPDGNTQLIRRAETHKDLFRTIV